MDTLVVEVTYPALAGSRWLCRVCRFHVNPETHVPNSEECLAGISERIWKHLDDE